MEAKDYNLEEVVIKGEKPLVKVEDGRLGYDLSVLSEKQAVSNAYEAITKLPGVQEKNGTLSLAGANSSHNSGKRQTTTMTSEQLETLLRNTPVNRIEKAEVMYSAPPELHVRGAVINVVMKRSHDYSFQGEVSTNYQNRYFSSGWRKRKFPPLHSKTHFRCNVWSRQYPNYGIYRTVLQTHLEHNVYENNTGRETEFQKLDAQCENCFGI